MPIHLHFLGAAGTVTGSQYLLETNRAKVVVDCGMFQGRPDERIRNLVPLGYDPTTIEASSRAGTTMLVVLPPEAGAPRLTAPRPA